MIIVYCPICRRVKIDASEARQMVADFDTDALLDQEDFEKEIAEADPEDLLNILSSFSLQTRLRIAVPEDFQGEDWVKLNDQEWGAIQTILNSQNLLYLVDNYTDYPTICPDCLQEEDKKGAVSKN